LFLWNMIPSLLGISVALARLELLSVCLI
jgi:hypothetical protein